MSSADPNHDGDPVIPTPSQIYPVLAASTQLWQHMSTRAGSMRMEPDTINLSKLARRLPSIPDSLRGVRSLSGQATWDLRSGGCVRLLPPRREAQRRWVLATKRPTLCTISKHRTFDFSDSESNGISLLFFGWSYILCTTLLERQGIAVHYVPPQPRALERPDDQCFTVDIGQCSEDELQWWKSLVLPGQGWRPRSGQPVWAVAYKGNMTFRVTGDAKPSSTRCCEPPSSKQAAHFLAKFASLYNLDSQAVLALSMVLTLPLHNEMNSTVTLPKPLLKSKRQRGRKTPISKILQEFGRLSRYMTLSFLSSALWAVFWDPGGDCNLVGPWCDPIIQVVETLVDGGNLEILGHVLAQRRPNIAPLWYGVLACGKSKIVHAIVPFLRTLHSPTPSRPIPEVAAWTATPQSFIDNRGSGPYVQKGGQVSREDVWRLRHECWDQESGGLCFSRPPTSPWRPFGSIPESELELSIRVHIHCERHSWIYARWTWFLDGEAVKVDDADVDNPEDLCTDLNMVWCKNQQTTMPAYTLNSAASEKAIGDIFRWSASEMEPSGERIYKHPWVDVLDMPIGYDFQSDTSSNASYERPDVGVWSRGVQVSSG